LHGKCNYAGVGQILPDLLGDLHAATVGPDAREALLMLVNATYAAMFTLRHLGYVAESALAAERCRQAAERLDEAVPLAVADYVRPQAAAAAGTYRRTLTLAERAVGELNRHLEEPTALDVLGMMHLTSALARLGLHEPAAAFNHVAEAQRIAERTGETTTWGM